MAAEARLPEDRLHVLREINFRGRLRRDAIGKSSKQQYCRPDYQNGSLQLVLPARPQAVP